MITGPDESPYANGCFFFDVNLPSSYPQVSPKVQFLTTKGGSIRFNPNLYNDGKVCLSLLGTWSGPGWVRGQSTLLQVLISIQSLILVPDPYYNEPAWETARGTEHGAAQSKQYNQTIRSFTLTAAIFDHLSSILGNTNQYVEFESAIINHFLEKRSLIQQEVWSWAKDDARLVPTVDKICSLLEQLSNRERNAARSRRMAKKAIEIINLYDSDEEETFQPHTKKPHYGPVKSNKPIEIDLSDDGEEKKDKSKAVAQVVQGVRSRPR
jgi:ubiquitin-protein ligase